jgi:hypothetical protein
LKKTDKQKANNNHDVLAVSSSKKVARTTVNNIADKYMRREERQSGRVIVA